MSASIISGIRNLHQKLLTAILAGNMHQWKCSLKGPLCLLHKFISLLGHNCKYFIQLQLFPMGVFEQEFVDLTLNLL